MPLLVVVRPCQIDDQPGALPANLSVVVRKQGDDEGQERALRHERLSVPRRAGGDVHEDVHDRFDDFGRRVD